MVASRFLGCAHDSFVIWLATIESVVRGRPRDGCDSAFDACSAEPAIAPKRPFEAAKSDKAGKATQAATALMVANRSGERLI
jgi:hypothetical protein